MKKLIVAIGLLGTSLPAFANFDAETLVGRRWYELDSHGFQSDEVMVAGYWQPSEFLHLSFGPSFSYYKRRDLNYDITSFSHYELGLQVKGWHDLTSSAGIYGKARYVGYSHGVAKGEEQNEFERHDSEADYRSDGFHLGLGTRYALSDHISLLAEAGFGVQMFKFTGGKSKYISWQGETRREKIHASHRLSFNSTSFMIGLNASI